MPASPRHHKRKKGQGTSDGFFNLSYNDFRRRALDHTLSPNEKIGFPNNLRKGFEKAIFRDIQKKTVGLKRRGLTVLDIGPGCSRIPLYLMSLCARQGHKLLLMDSQEMLQLLPDRSNTFKIPGRFPHDLPSLAPHLRKGVDIIIAYSVLQHVFLDDNPFTFTDEMLGLLNPGGELLIGDIPNISKRHRFLSTAEGVKFHRKHFIKQKLPLSEFNRLEPGKITDAVVLGLIERARAAGFDAYILPQDTALPMSNRREDIYIRKP